MQQALLQRKRLPLWPRLLRLAWAWARASRRMQRMCRFGCGTPPLEGRRLAGTAVAAGRAARPRSSLTVLGPVLSMHLRRNTAPAAEQTALVACLGAATRAVRLARARAPLWPTAWPACSSSAAPAPGSTASQARAALHPPPGSSPARSAALASCHCQWAPALGCWHRRGEAQSAGHAASAENQQLLSARACCYGNAWHLRPLYGQCLFTGNGF